MSKPQSFKRIIVEDYDAKDRDLISKLGYSINPFADDILNALNNQITISDNLNWAVKDLVVKVDSSGKPVSVLNIKTGLDHICQGTMVIKVTDQVTPGNPPSGTPFITFSENNGIISITNITNLVANNAYSLRIILF